MGGVADLLGEDAVPLLLQTRGHRFDQRFGRGIGGNRRGWRHAIQESARRTNGWIANRLPHARHAVEHAADEDADAEHGKRHHEDERVKDIPGEPAIDDPARAGDMLRDPRGNGTVANGADQHQHRHDGDLRDGDASRAEKAPDAIDGDVEERAFARS